ncbi:Serine/threonine-protein kinase fray2 [Leucoagaricus sp. SymC.cos]|nr:Serine/threonine-protein kinase fray2 [Leucoagaricus sp. SymC.cos]
MASTTGPSSGLPGTASRGLTSEAMGFINKKFIGAVEDEWTLFSDQASDYTIGEPIGYGASSTVYTATYHPRSTDPHNPQGPPIPCALKVLDLDTLPRRSLQLLQRETTLMSLSKHPNVLRVRGSWIDGYKLYIALRLMNKGSAADVMRYGWPGGMEEDVVRCILRQALEGLNYLHINGFIHRDIKAANMLIDDDGTVLLGDLGVAADLSEDSSNQMQMLNESYTKPCWMAPELIAGRQYDCAADVWSFGITALELCQGRPPRSRESSKDVLLRIIHDAPPTLDREGGTHKYSRAFKELIDSCLEKDPSKRPTAEQLLQLPFFKAAKKRSYLINTILKNLPPLTRRQERRTSRHPPTVATVDSWDFPSTIHSPTNTVLGRRKHPGDFPSPTPEREESIGVFHFDDDDKAPDPREEENRPSTSSSSEGDESTDVTRGGFSTPPTNPSSFSDSPLGPRSSRSDPLDQLSSLPRAEGPVKKGFWSRITSGVRRRPSFSKRSASLLIASKVHPNATQRSPPVPNSKYHVAVEQKELLGESLRKNLKKQPSRDLAMKHFQAFEKNAAEQFSVHRGGAGATRAELLPVSSGRKKGMDGAGTVKAGLPSSKGKVLGGFIGEAKSKLSIS